MRTSAPDGKIPGQNDNAYLSLALIERVKQPPEIAGFRRRRFFSEPTWLEKNLHEIFSRRIPKALLQQCSEMLDSISSMQGFLENTSLLLEIADFTVRLAISYKVTPAIAAVLIRGLTREESRETILSANGLNWPEVWSAKLSKETAQHLLQLFDAEIDFHVDDEGRDYDIAYIADIVVRIRDGEIVDASEVELRDRSRELLRRAAKFYSEIGRQKAMRDRPPQVAAVVDQIAARDLEDNAAIQDAIQNINAIESEMGQAMNTAEDAASDTEQLASKFESARAFSISAREAANAIRMLCDQVQTAAMESVQSGSRNEAEGWRESAVSNMSMAKEWLEKAEHSRDSARMIEQSHLRTGTQAKSGVKPKRKRGT